MSKESVAEHGGLECCVPEWNTRVPCPCPAGNEKSDPRQEETVPNSAVELVSRLTWARWRLEQSGHGESSHPRSSTSSQPLFAHSFACIVTNTCFLQRDSARALAKRSSHPLCSVGAYRHTAHRNCRHHSDFLQNPGARRTQWPVNSCNAGHAGSVMLLVQSVCVRNGGVNFACIAHLHLQRTSDEGVLWACCCVHVMFRFFHSHDTGMMFCTWVAGEKMSTENLQKKWASHCAWKRFPVAATLQLSRVSLDWKSAQSQRRCDWTAALRGGPSYVPLPTRRHPIDPWRWRPHFASGAGGRCHWDPHRKPLWGRSASWRSSSSRRRGNQHLKEARPCGVLIQRARRGIGVVPGAK